MLKKTEILISKWSQAGAIQSASNTEHSQNQASQMMISCLENVIPGLKTSTIACAYTQRHKNTFLTTII